MIALSPEVADRKTRMAVIEFITGPGKLESCRATRKVRIPLMPGFEISVPCVLRPHAGSDHVFADLPGEL